MKYSYIEGEDQLKKGSKKYHKYYHKLFKALYEDTKELYDTAIDTLKKNKITYNKLMEQYNEHEKTLISIEEEVDGLEEDIELKNGVIELFNKQGRFDNLSKKYLLDIIYEIKVLNSDVIIDKLIENGLERYNLDLIINNRTMINGDTNND